LRKRLSSISAGNIKGRTPNPCIACNRYIKFESLLHKARGIGVDYIATGHYSRIVRDRENEEKYLLLTGVDPTKDQSYALYSMTQEQLKHTLFPLGDRKKEEVRAIAREAGLPVFDKPESQEICFVSDDNYAGFVEEYLDIPPVCINSFLFFRKIIVKLSSPGFP
jgi:tRNA-specific 2-thiouridylase